jgi:ATP-dependent helicase/nuclease subunit B
MKNRIIYGTSRKRNTEKCITEVNSFLRHGAGENLYIVVPEQYSSYYEQLLVSKSIEKGSFQAEVLTFKRLAHRIFTRNLNLKNNYIDNAGNCMLMYDVVNSQKDSLKAFSKASAYPAFASEAISMIKEFKRYGLNDKDILASSEVMENQLLSAKLRELSLLYKNYSERLTQSGFWDAEDDLSELALEIEKTYGIGRTIFWFDSFDGFTPAEMLVIKALIQHSKAVTFVLCSDSLALRDRSDIFKPVVDTALKIISITEELGTSTDIMRVPEEDSAFSGVHGELEHLANNYFKYPEIKYNEKTQNIALINADSIYDEVENCALDIIQNVRNGKYRYGDICVVSGLYEEYSNYIDAIFTKYDIPVFLDEKRAIGRHPASAFMLALLDIYIEKYSYDSVFSFLKSPYSDFNADDVSKLENYVLEFDIKGVENWNSEDWVDIPFKSRDRSAIEDYNRIRRELTEFLNPIFIEFRYGLSGDSFSRLIFDFLEKQHVFNKINEEAKAAEDEGRLEYSDELKQSWNILMDILDQVRTVVGDKKLTVEKFRHLLEIAFNQKKIGLIPPRTDVVFAGKLNKAFGIDIKMLVILGANDPGFPEGIMPEGLFSDKERNELKFSGFELAPDTASQVMDRQIDVYNLLHLPTDRLYVSYSSRGNDGAERRPSPFIDRVKDIFPDITVSSAGSSCCDEYILTPMTGISLALKSKEKNSPLVRWYLENGYGRFFEKQIDSLTEEEFRDVIKKLLGDVLETSATSLESYASCPYRYFADHILNAGERRIFSISPPDVGSILHDILRNLVFNFKDEKSSQYSDYLKDALKAFDEMPISRIFKRNARMDYLGRRIVTRAVDAYLALQKQIDEGKFKPVEFEASFGRNKRLGAPWYQTGNSRVYLRGRIDRVDAAMVNDTEYFRIIDYKSSYNDIKLCKIKEGLDIQLPLYMMAYMSNTGTKPAGMYYFNAAKKIVAADYNIDPEEIKEKIQQDSRLSGYTLSNNDVINAMDENISKSSKNINVKMNASGEFTGKLITESDVSSMTKAVEKHIIEKTAAIYDGKYEVNPVRYENSWACEYCRFKGICGFDKARSDCRYRSISETKDKDLEWDDSE